MTVKTYETIGMLISNIKRSKNVINHNEERIDRDFKKLNELLTRNGQPEMKLEDIKPLNEYDCEENEF